MPESRAPSRAEDEEPVYLPSTLNPYLKPREGGGTDPWEGSKHEEEGRLGPLGPTTHLSLSLTLAPMTPVPTVSPPPH